MLLAACLWGTIGPVSRVVFAAGLSPLETAFWRGTVAGMAYLLHFVWAKRISTNSAVRHGIQLNTTHLPWIVLFGVFGVALLEGSYVYAVYEGGASLASVLLYSAPLWVNLFGWKFFREHISVKQRFALLLTTLGITGISFWGAPVTFSAVAITAGLFSGLSYALFYIAGRLFFQSSHPVAVYMIAFPVGSLAILPVIYLTQGIGVAGIIERALALNTTPLLALLGVGFISTYIPYIFHGLGLKKVPTGKASIITSFEPVVSIVLSHVMWTESFSVIGYVCAALVILGVVLAG